MQLIFLRSSLKEEVFQCKESAREKKKRDTGYSDI